MSMTDGAGAQPKSVHQSTFPGGLLCTRHCARCWGCTVIMMAKAYQASRGSIACSPQLCPGLDAFVQCMEVQPWPSFSWSCSSKGGEKMHKPTEYTIRIRVTREAQECMKKETEPGQGESEKSLQI